MRPPSPLILPDRIPTRREVARHYDELDRVYRELWGEHLHHGYFLSRSDDPADAAVRLVDLVGDLGGIGHGSRVVDVGCGYGATARRLVERRGAEVTGITLSEAQHRRAVEAAPPELPLRFLLGDWLDNRFPDGSFDVAIAIESLAHMPDKARFFRELRRTVRPGGRVVVCAWVAGEGVGRMGRRFLLEPICREGELPGMGTVKEYCALAEADGFRILEVRDLTPEVRRTWSVSARRLAVSLLRRPEYRRLLRNRELRSRVFALSVLRIWMAYHVGAMRYAVLVAERR